MSSPIAQNIYFMSCELHRDGVHITIRARAHTQTTRGWYELCCFSIIKFAVKPTRKIEINENNRNEMKNQTTDVQSPAMWCERTYSCMHFRWIYCGTSQSQAATHHQHHFRVNSSASRQFYGISSDEVEWGESNLMEEKEMFRRIRDAPIVCESGATTTARRNFAKRPERRMHITSGICIHDEIKRMELCYFCRRRVLCASLPTYTGHVTYRVCGRELGERIQAENLFKKVLCDFCFDFYFFTWRLPTRYETVQFSQFTYAVGCHRLSYPLLISSFDFSRFFFAKNLLWSY